MSASVSSPPGPLQFPPLGGGASHSAPPEVDRRRKRGLPLVDVSRDSDGRRSNTAAATKLLFIGEAGRGLLGPTARRRRLTVHRAARTEDGVCSAGAPKGG